MTVARIINEKGRDVVTVSPGRLAGRDRGDARGEADRRRRRRGEATRSAASSRSATSCARVAKHGGEALAKLAADCMTAKVVTCRPEDTINDVMQKMTAGRFRHLPVVEDGKLAGIVSIGDVVKRRIEEVEREADADPRIYRDRLSAALASAWPSGRSRTRRSSGPAPSGTLR